MFQAFPRARGEWLGLLIYPFQAYVLVAYIVAQCFIRSLPANGGYRGSLSEFKLWVISGYALCFLVLLVTGIAQLSAGRHRRGWVNVGLAFLGAALGLSLMSFVHT